MRTLSTNIFYYYRVVVAILAPILILIVIIKLANARNPPVFIVLLCLLLVLFLTQWIWILKYRQVSYNDTTLSIKSYFAYRSNDLPLENVISLVRKSDLYRLNLTVNYKMIYVDNGKKNTIYFYRALELAKVNDLENYLKRQKLKPILIPNVPFAGEKTISIQKRLTSAALDQFVMTLVSIIIAFPFLIFGFITNFKDESKGPKLHLTPLLGFCLIGIALFFCKDCLYGQSFAKKELKLQVINNKTGQIANPIRCFVRNIFMVIWPVEVIFLLSNPARRLGDFIAGTKLVPFDMQLKRPEINYLQLILVFILSYAFVLSVSLWS